MPAHKRPVSLYNLCRSLISSLIDIACHNIWNRFGVFGNVQTRQAIVQLQLLLTSCIAVQALDDICNMQQHGRFLNASILTQGDIQILIATLMHQHMTVFKLPILDIPNTLTSRLDEGFWQDCLANMPHLVILDLSLVCTDSILQVIGETCHLLEEVTVISKMSEVRGKQRFNALKKIYHVSDEGLKHLTHCKKLKHVSLNASNRYGLGDITDKGICFLISSLPDLHSINYEYMGSVLSHLPTTSHTLALRQLKDLRSNPDNIMLFNRLCPHLSVLHVALPTFLDDGINRTQSEAIIENLGRSVFPLELLRLNFMYFTNAMLLPLLIVKGENLTNICFGAGCWSTFDVNTLKILAYYCPNIIDLAICTMGTNPESPFTFQLKRDKIFTKLRILHLSSGFKDWDVSFCASYCMRGNQVSQLYLSGPVVELDSMLFTALESGRLTELASLVLNKHCTISSATVWTILESCPRIKKIYLVFNSQLSRADADSFRNYIRTNNLDVDMKFSDGSRNGWFTL